ncbi:MAG: 30S ribosomal protein S20 [Clostridia bacterium]|nr:30S ribosomal protein S20 [Clostridia bacterium]MDD4386428.1 30S ribosomal protein S20 [Clostridia bacterium]
MPNIKSAMKRVKIIATKTAQNRVTKKAYKEAVKAFESGVKENKENVKELYATAVSLVDKAWSKGVLAKNTAARKKANLTKSLTK